MLLRSSIYSWIIKFHHYYAFKLITIDEYREITFVSFLLIFEKVSIKDRFITVDSATSDQTLVQQ